MASAPSWFEFRALGTYVHVQTRGGVAAPRRRAQEILKQVDLACSRFRSDSDLSRANALPGRWTPVSSLFLAALGVAVAAAEETDGLVDPCLGRTLIEYGYDRDFGRLQERESPVRFAEPSNRAWSRVAVDDGAVRVPSGVALDLGATAKAWASDLVALSLFEEFGEAVAVSLGGDIATAGPAADWPIQVSEHPGSINETVAPAEIWLSSGGLATSSTQVRRWRSGGAEFHHIVDPRTGRPVDAVWRTVTATGPTCVAANVATTAALVLAGDAVEWLDEREVSARLVAQDGSVHLVGGWPASDAAQKAVQA